MTAEQIAADFLASYDGGRRSAEECLEDAQELVESLLPAARWFAWKQGAPARRATFRGRAHYFPRQPWLCRKGRHLWVSVWMTFHERPVRICRRCGSVDVL